MSKDNDFSPLLSRLNLVIDAAKERLAGAELGQLILIAFEQQAARLDMKWTRAGRKRGLDALVAHKYVELENDEPRLHSELCARYGIAALDGKAVGAEFLKQLTEGLAEIKVCRKDLYRCNSAGEPASDDELAVLHAKLFNAAVRCAATLGEVSEPEVRKSYHERKWECSRDLEMKGFASVVQGFLDGIDKGLWPGDLRRAVYTAIYHVHPSFPQVLDPHRLLEKWGIEVQRLHEVLNQKISPEDAAKAQQNLAVQAPHQRSQGANPAVNG